MKQLNEGGIGVISGVNIRYDEEDFESNTLEENLRALRKYLKIAKEKCNNGIMIVQPFVDI